MKYHINVNIERAIQELAKGHNVFDSTPLEAMHALLEARAKGHRVYTGCDSINPDGSCAGHIL